jgi:alkylation response protein AidB-like acyl-CoA dehydrogenase
MNVSTDQLDHRYADYSLDDDQCMVVEVFRGFYTNEVPPARVRRAEPIGHDEQLWSRLVEMGATAMAVPLALGGDGASLLDLALVAEEHGAAMAPAPLIEHVVTTRLLARCGAVSTIARDAATSPGIATMALAPAPPQARVLVPAGAVADRVVVTDGSGVWLMASPRLAYVSNLGATPLGRLDPPHDRVELVSGGDAEAWFVAAVLEWKVLTAAALVGLTQRALDLAVDSVKSRSTLGVPLGSLQGVAFPLADVAIGLAGARNLVRKAAWYADHEPGTRPDLMHAAWVYAVEVAGRGVETAQHMQGGLGFTLEADASLYFMRAKGWSALAGDPMYDALAVGDDLARAAGARQ